MKLTCCVCRWFPEVQNIFYQGNKRHLVPTQHEQDKLDAYFNCAATLMTGHLQSLLLDSLNDYVDLLVQPPVHVILIYYNLYRLF